MGIYSLGILIVDRFLQICKGFRLGRDAKLHWVIILVSWHAVLIFTAPPLLDIFGRYGLEPSGTMCTIDFWHGNFRNYNNFVFFLVTFGFGLPISIMLYMFLKCVQGIQQPENTKHW